jgi:hypothetical protein
MAKACGWRKRRNQLEIGVGGVAKMAVMKMWRSWLAAAISRRK